MKKIIFKEKDMKNNTNEFSLFFNLQCRLIKNSIRTWHNHSRLKIAVISFFVTLFFSAIFFIFYRSLQFLRFYIPSDFFSLMIEYIFAIFFFSLFLMLIFSSLVIALSAFFHTPETKFLMTSPLSFAGIFFYKFSETFLFASWSIFFLGIPICFVYGIQEGAPWFFYPATILLFIPFTILSALIGTLMAYFLVYYLLRFKKILSAILLIILGGSIFFVIMSWISVRQRPFLPTFETEWFFNLLSYLKSFQNPFLPSVWISKALMSLTQNNFSNYLFFLCLLVVNSLFLGAILYLYTSTTYGKAFSKIHSYKGKQHIWRFQWTSMVQKIFFFLRPQDRLFLEKDIKIFLRDPIQWSQFAILLCLLLFYILNLRTLKYDEQLLFWKHLIATLNLVATSLINCTFASRFIFPMLSLEGKRFWMLGVMPLEKTGILIAKFIFALVTLSITSEFLILLSCYMLRLPWTLTLLYGIITLFLSLGSAGLSVGLGALYPNFKEDSPSKIVSGFGGTLNLILNLAFVLSIVFFASVPSYWILRNRLSAYTSGIWIFLSVATTFTATFLPLYLGIRALKKLEF